MLAHADAAGWVDIHPRAIAEETGLSVEAVKTAIAELEAPDPESRSPDEEGRRIVLLDGHRAWGWRIVNHGKYRAIRNEEDRREQNRLAQQRFRAKDQESKQSKPRKPPSAQAEAEALKPPAPDGAIPPKKKPVIACPEDVSTSVWEDWVALRKAKKAPVTQTVLNGARVEAGKAKMTLEAFLSIWCTRGSQGLQADWIKPAERQTQKPLTAGEARMLEACPSLVSESVRQRAKPMDYIDAEPTTTLRMGGPIV